MASHPNADSVRVSSKKNQIPLAFGPHSHDPGLVSLYDEYFDVADDEQDVLEVTYKDILGLDELYPEDRIKDWAVDSFYEKFVLSPDPYLYGLVRWARETGGYDDVTLRGQISGNHRRIEDLRASDIGTLVSMDVRCSDRTDTFPVVREASIRCRDCSVTMTRWQSREDGDIEFPVGCTSCDAGKRRLEHDMSKSELLDTQQVILQDLHTLASAYDPYDMQGQIHGHLVGELESGDTVTVTAIVRADESDSKKSDLYLQIVGLSSMDNEIDALELSDEDIERIEKLAERDDIYDKLSQSFAPDIRGTGSYTIARHALMYQWFGGVPTGEFGTEDYRRGDIHVALVGDPGTGKSKLGKGSGGPVPTSEYVSADNVTKVGMTAAVQNEERFDGSEWTVKGGALVKADGGHAVVDEVDSADDDMQSGLQEALGEQQISVSKGGVRANLPSRCSTTLIANPEGEQFDIYRPLDKQISLNPTIWSRMDIIIPFVDMPDEEHDRDVSRGVLGRASSDTDYEVLDKELVAKYISYSREIEPKLSDEAQQYLEDNYVEKRQSAGDGRVAIGPRQLDGMRRIAQASARIRLSETVELEDAKRAHDLMKAWMSLLIPDEKGAWDINNLVGKTTTEIEEDDALWRVIDMLSNEKGVADRKAVQETMEEEFDIDEAYQVVNKLVGREDLVQNEDEDGNTILLDQR